MRKLFIITAIVLAFSSKDTMAQIFSLNANTLSPIVLALQTEMEISVSQKYTLSAGITLKPTGKYRIGGPHLSARRYMKESFVGPFTSLSAGYLTYNINKEFEKKGNSMYVSISAGYNFIITKRLNMKLELGASLFSARDGYTLHTPDPWEDDYRYTTKRLLLLPYPVSLSICYIF